MTTGLYVFIGVLILNIAGLSLDGLLYLFCGYDCTVTALVRTSQPWVGFVIRNGKKLAIAPWKPG